VRAAGGRTIEELLATLRRNRVMRTNGEARAFDEALQALGDRPDAEVRRRLPDLFLVFEDACEMHEVMWGLLHAVEHYGTPGDEDVRAFGRVAPELAKRARSAVRHLLEGIRDDANSGDQRAKVEEVLS
jgi:hypothetical protein